MDVLWTYAVLLLLLHALLHLGSHLLLLKLLLVLDRHVLRALHDLHLLEASATAPLRVAYILHALLQLPHC